MYFAASRTSPVDQARAGCKSPPAAFEKEDTLYLGNHGLVTKGKKKLWFLDRVFEKWHALLTDYESAMVWGKEWDLPYWYRERANTGHLATSAHLCGAVVLQEFRTKRLEKGSPPKSGRADLWFQSPEGNDYYVEAKFSKRPFGSRGLVDHLQEQLDAAEEQILSAPEVEICNSSLALVFLVPYRMLKKCDGGEIPIGFSEECAASLKELEPSTKNGFDILTWHWAERRFVKPLQGAKNAYLYPGIVVVGRFVKQS